MPSDPGLSKDTCIYSEAVAGDGGNHNPSSTWWLSPDITLTGPTSGPDKADPGQINICKVIFHRKSAESQCIFSDAESLTVELWVGNPSIVMAPDNPNSAVRIGYIGTALPGRQREPGNRVDATDWTAPERSSGPGSQVSDFPRLSGQSDSER